MIPISINNQTYFFSVNHITKPFSTKLVYGISLNSKNYFLGKTIGINECEQLDSNPLLAPVVLDEICKIMTEIENAYKQRPSLEFINSEIFKILGRIRNTAVREVLMVKE
jgi:hypothetical protein